MLTLDASQRAVVDLAPGTGAVVVGAPGSGKTTTLVALAAARIASGLPADGVLAIAGSRQSAALLRDRMARELQVVSTGPLARTASSIAFELVRELRRAAGEPEPRLLSGADQDLLIRELLDGQPDGAWPAHLDAAVRRLPEFRTELRELLMRATEYGVSGDGLRRAAQQTGRPEWASAAGFHAEYLDVTGFVRPDHLDPAELGDVAVRAASEGHLGERLSQVRLLLVDELQQATEGTLRLLAEFARRDVEIVAFGDPDIASNTFRGGEPDFLARFRELVADLPQHTLESVHRGGPALRAVVQSVTERIGAAGAVTHRRAAATGVDDALPVVALEAPSATVLADSVARALRERHLLDGVPWSRLAVVVRSGRQVPALARALALAQVPTRTLAGGTALRDDVAAGALLRVVALAIGREALTGPSASEVLLGPFGGMDPIGVRRLRLALRAEELAGGGTRYGDELLVDALQDPARLATIDHAVARRASRVAGILQAVRDLDARGGSAEELLWQAWHGSGVADAWQRTALGSGIAAEEANRALDGVVALFASARRFAERAPERSASDYLDEVLDAEVPEDTLAPQSVAETVLVATPAGTAGQEFDTVVIAGLQEGAWPNLRPRNSLLGAQQLVEWARGRADTTADERRAVLSDELRIFALAASRATRRLVVAAIASDDETPSALFDLVAGRDPGDAEGARRNAAPRSATDAVADAGVPRIDVTMPALGLRAMVGRLRRELTSVSAPDRRAAAAAALAVLAAEGAPGAHPDTWRGLLPVSTDAPIYDLADPGARVPVSPSRLEEIERSPMEAFVASVSGGASTVVAGLGTLVHDVLEHATGHEVEELWSALQERWGELRFESDVEAERQLRFARTTIEALARYLRDVEEQGGSVLLAEQRLELDIAPAKLTGKIDRVEVYTPGLVIMDLKTGRHPISKNDAQDHPQLGAYQLAYADGGLGDAVAGHALHEARLIFTSSDTAAPYTVRQQSAFDEARLEEFRERVRAAARAMTGPQFDAVIIDDPYQHGGEVRAVQLPGEVSSDE